MPPPRYLLMGATTALLGVMAAIMLGEAEVDVPAGGYSASVALLRDGGPVPPGWECVWTQGFAQVTTDPETGEDFDPLLMFADAGLRQDAGRYGITRIAVGPLDPNDDGGPPDDLPLPPGVIAFPDQQWSEPCDGGAAFFIALQGSDSYPCACRVTADCQWKNPNIPDAGWEEAPLWLTFQPGKWRDTSDAGTGCFRKTCTELFGYSSWPSECPIE